MFKKKSVLSDPPFVMEPSWAWQLPVELSFPASSETTLAAHSLAAATASYHQCTHPLAQRLRS